MTIIILLSSPLFAASLSSLTAGDLIVSEVMHTPVASVWYRGEWLEVHNTTADTIDLDGLVVSDGDGESFTLSGTLEVSAGGYAVLALRDEPLVNGGLPVVDYVYLRSDFSLRSRDQVVLSYGSTILDTVSWDASFPTAIGQSLSLDPGAIDSSLASSWCAGWSVYGDGDGGTPGAENDDCTFSLAALSEGDLLISEVMHSPAAADYNKGEWLEITNNTDVYVDLEGLVVSDSGSDVFVIDESFSLAPGGHAVLAARDNYLVNGGIEDVAWRYFYGSELRLLSSDDISLSYGVVTFDEVSWDSSYPAEFGVSMQIDIDQLDPVANDDAAAWCAGTSTYGDGDYGTPGMLNDDCINDLDGDGYEDDVDCDDSDSAIRPDAVEVCDSVDNNCDGDIDEDSAADASVWYADADDDLYGDLASPRAACVRPTGYRINALDCDDTSATIHPGAEESACDGLDSDCSGDDEGCTSSSDLTLTWDFTADPADAWVEFNQKLSAEDDCYMESIFGSVDINGDGVADLVVGTSQTLYEGEDISIHNLTSVLYGPISGGIDIDDADVTIGTDSTYEDAIAAEVSSPGDIDGDGYDDLIVGQMVPDSTLYSSPYGSYYVRDAGVSIFYGPLSGTIDILDADDTIVTGGGRHNIVYHHNHYFPGYTETDSLFVLQEPYSSGDGDYELMVFDGLEGPSTTITVPTVGYALAEAALFGGFVGDLNADGEQEVLVGDSEQSTALLFVSPLSEDMTSSDAAITATSVVAPTDGGVQGAADLDGDGYDDLMMVLEDIQYVFYGPVTGVTPADADAYSADLFTILVNDLDQNGTMDVLMAGESGFSSGVYTVDYHFFSGTLTGNIDTADAVLFSEDAYAVPVTVGGDLSGDGLTDFLLDGATGSYGGDDVLLSVILGSLVE